MLSPEGQYSVNLSISKENFVEVCIIMGAIVFYLLMLQKQINSKGEILK